ncbi:hypothetical protein TrLO_g15777 [Triparma laevis f. longispina]|uniref:Tyrosine-protein kinase ephrin type A/B receptor-like domain-containing protein n=1 Tax=Triparma laevis f. longispina TaxID=1714387 RepID=A0A9W7KTJ7_9STRA|nr:hypothetical protein TrLO_g15777 [Triparma laevis f. longispina]
MPSPATILTKNVQQPKQLEPATTVPNPADQGAGPCAAGHYCPQGSQTSQGVGACVAGEYAPPGSGSCHVCPARTFLSDAGTSPDLHDSVDDCVICLSGTYNPDAGTSASLHIACILCLPGSELPDDGTDVSKHDSSLDCELCGPNTFSNAETGFSTCTPCSEGEFSIAGSPSCSACPPGFICAYDEDGKTTSTEAYLRCTYTYTMAGKKRDETKKVSLDQILTSQTSLPKVCELGYKCPGGMNRVACLQGSFQADSGSTTCNPCEAGTYQANPGQAQCEPCLEGHFCPTGTVTQIKCGSVALFCPSNSGTVQSADEGYYTTPLSTETTTKREGQAVCEVTLPLKDGYWRSSSQSDNIVKCEIDASCARASPDKNCTIGHAGPICSVCTEGYNKNAVGVCEICSSASLSIGFYALLIVLGAITLYLVLRKIFGKEKFTISNVTQDITNANSNDKHWSKRLKTKAKILTSFYQIVSKLPSTLAVQYPDFYSGFTTAINSVFNFNAIGLISVGCFLLQSIYSFYGSFLVTTLTPIGLSLLLLLVTLRQKRTLDPYAANKLIASRFSLFYGFTYLIFASTSMMAFTTYLCTTYGDDETRYLIADRSIDCHCDFHKKFEILSAVMVLVYPVGITTIYTYELWKHREAIQDAEKREDNPNIQQIVFLWRDYRPEFWRFEIYECFRRLSFTGMLVFFEPGSPPQLCFSIFLALVGSLMYSYNQPFEKTEENTLAQISSVSIFLTLLAGILITLKENLSEEFSSQLSALLVIVNTLVFAMIEASVLFKPMLKFAKKLNEKHIHDAPLKGMGTEVAYSVELFIDYFKKLVGSDEKEPLKVKDWSGKKKKITSEGVAVSAPPPPLPVLSQALATAMKKGGRRLTTNPIFAGLKTGDSSVVDEVNIEMGRMVKKKMSKSDDDENNIVVL